VFGYADFFVPGCLPLARISSECVMDLPRDFNLLRRIAPRGREVSSSTSFSLCTVAQPQLKPHRQNVLLDRAGPALQLFAVKLAGSVHRFLVRNAH